VSAAAAPTGTLQVLVVIVALAVLVVGPGFVLLYVLAQRDLLPEEGVPDAADEPQGREPPGGGTTAPDHLDGGMTAHGRGADGG
jgi:cytochrome d ubiquinol oxidase subunit II